MKEVTVTELSHHLHAILEGVEHRGEEVFIVRDNRQVACIVPAPLHRTAMEVMTDLYQILPEEAAVGWLEASRRFGDGKEDDTGAPGRVDEMHDPWAS